MKGVEDEFVVKTARTVLTKEEAGYLKGISVRITDWDFVLNKAVMHGVSGIIYYTLNKYGLSNLMHAGVFEKLRLKYYNTALRNIYAEKTIKQITDICNEKIVLLKGAYLYKHLYPASGMRFLSDVDILTAKDSAQAVRNKLLKSGFKEWKAKSRLHDRFSEEHFHLPQLHNYYFKVEIHKNLFRDEVYENITAEAFFTAERIDKSLFVLTPEMNIIHFCCHFIHHINNGSDLKMLCDINETVRRFQDSINWEKIKQIAEKLRKDYDISIPLTYCFLLLETPVPEGFLNSRILKNKDLNLDDIMKDENIKKRRKNSLRKDLKSVDKLHEKLVFIFRHFIPMSGYVNCVFGVYDDKFRFLNYWRYYKRGLRRLV